MSEKPLPPEPTLVHELQARAEKIFGRAPELVRLDEDRPLGRLMDKVRNPAIPSPDPVLAVKCGDGLCAIAINGLSDETVQHMLKANGWSCNTVWASWRGLFIIFVRVNGERPNSCSFRSEMWITEDLVPLADITPETTLNSFPLKTKGTSVLSLSYDDINWHDSVDEWFLLNPIQEQCGPLFMVAANGRASINDLTAAKFILATLKLKRSAMGDVFFATGEDGLSQPMPRAKLANFIETWLQKTAALVGYTVNPSASDSPVPAIIQRLRQLCAANHITEAESVQQFISDRLQRKDGAALASVEIVSAYRDWCKARGVTCGSRQVFLQHLAIGLREHLGVCRSHSVRRSNPEGELTSRAGYWGLAFTQDD